MIRHRLLLNKHIILMTGVAALNKCFGNRSIQESGSRYAFASKTTLSHMLLNYFIALWMRNSKFAHNHVLFLLDCVFDELWGRVTCTICLPPDLKTTGTDNLREWIPAYECWDYCNRWIYISPNFLYAYVWTSVQSTCSVLINCNYRFSNW